MESLDVSCADLKDREVAGTEPASAWTGIKKLKIQTSPPNPEEGEWIHASPTSSKEGGRVTIYDESEDTVTEPEEQDQDIEGLDDQEIEGLDWDSQKLNEKIRGLRKSMHETSLDEDYASAHDDELWAEFNEEQQTTLNQRLALCRIRAHEEHYRYLSDARLLEDFPPKVLEDNGYYEHYECDFDWFFDPTYCKFARVEDYQRLVLRVTVEFEGLEICPYAHNKLVDDQQFVQFWEKLSRKTKLIELYIKERSQKRKRIENLLLYHALKIAEDFPSVYNTTIVSRIREFVSGVEDDYAFGGFLTKMIELLTKKQMNFADALGFVYNEGKCQSMFLWGDEFEPNLFAMERLYKHHLEHIVEKARYGSSVHHLVMDTIVENFWKPRTYYEYVRKKLRIAEEIGLIPEQPTHKLYVPGCFLRSEATMKTSGGKMASLEPYP